LEFHRQTIIIKLYIDETLINSIKQKHPTKGRNKKKRNKERAPKSNLEEEQNPKWVTKGQRNKSCSKAPKKKKKKREKDDDGDDAPVAFLSIVAPVDNGEHP